MKFLPFYCNYIVVCDNIILHKLLGKLGAKMKKFTGFLAIFMVVLLCVPSFTAVFADTYSSSVSTVQDGNESESSTDNTTDNVQTYPYDLEEGIYKIKYQNKVLTGVSSEQNGGQTFIFADEQESDEQLFCFEKLEQDKYKIVQQSSQKVLTAQDNTAVFSDWNDDETQYWSLVSTEEGTVFLKSYNHQMVVVSSENTLQLSYNMPNESFSFERAVNSYSTNSNVENTVDSQEKQTLNSAQQKDVVIPDGYYEIRSAVSGKNLEVYGVSTLGGAKITQWYATGGKNQKWKVENQADGSVRITNVNSGLVLDYNGSVNAYEQWDWHGGSNQRWEISKTSTEGNYCIRNQSNGYAMDVLYGTMEDGQHVVSYEYNGGVNQQWQFIKTDCNATQVVPDGYYEIKSAVSGKDLEVYGASLLGGGKVTQWDSTGGNNQKWKLENQSDGTIRLTNVNSGLVLDYNASTNSYEQWDWHGGSNQRWQISKSQAGNYYIRNMSNNHAMDVLYGSINNGQYVVDYEYNGGINQQWQLVPTKIEQVMPDGYYEIRSAVSGKNLEVYGVSTQGGAKITQWDATGGNNQKWKLENQSDGTIRLTNVNSGLVLDYNASTNSYEQWDWHGGSNQRWQISKSQAGNYYIRNMSNNHAMDVLYGNTGNGQYVVDYEYNGGINQQWQLVPTTIEQIIPDGYYEIRSAVSGKNLEVYGVSMLSGAKITQWYATGGKNQKWKVENQDDGNVRITNVNSGLVLEYNGNTNAYEQRNWNGGSNQKWEISKTSTEGNYCIRNQSNGYAMDVLYGAMEDGDHVVSYEYNGGVNQQWQFIQTDPDTTQVVPDGYYEIKSAVSGKNLEVYGASTQGGAKITQWDATGGNNQKWKLENQSDGTIRLTNVNSGLVLDYNASTNSYEQWDWHGGSNQRWQISKSQAGNYYIRNMSNNHAMDVLYGSMNNGQYVVDYEYNGGINQQWQLVPVELKTLQGIDVSEHQGNINWQQVKASGQVDFAIIRAGYGRETYQKDSFLSKTMQVQKRRIFQLEFISTAMRTV